MVPKEITELLVECMDMLCPLETIAKVQVGGHLIKSRGTKLDIFENSLHFHCERYVRRAKGY